MSTHPVCGRFLVVRFYCSVICSCLSSLSPEKWVTLTKFPLMCFGLGFFFHFNLCFHITNSVFYLDYLPQILWISIGVYPCTHIQVHTHGMYVETLYRVFKLSFISHFLPSIFILLSHQIMNCSISLPLYCLLMSSLDYNL